MSSLDGKLYFQKPFWEYDDDQLLEKYIEECKTVKKGVCFDIDKCFSDGKSLIIEGYHILPELYSFIINGNKQTNDINKDSFNIANLDSFGNPTDKCIIIPIILSISRKDHYFCIHKSDYLNKDDIYGRESTTEREDSENNLLEKLRIVNDYLISNLRHFKQMEVSLDNFSKLTVIN